MKKFVIPKAKRKPIKDSFYDKDYPERWVNIAIFFISLFAVLVINYGNY